MVLETAGLVPRDPNYIFTSERLASGLTMVEVQQPHLRRCAISVYFRIGSRFEGPETNGLSHFVEHMLFRGTLKHPTAFDISRAIEYLGGNFNASTSPDTTDLEMVLPPSSAPEGLELLSEILGTPVFKDIDIERRVIVEEILEDLDERGRSVDIDFLSRTRLWPGHPLGQSVIGSVENIESFKIDDITHHYRAHYVADNAVLCISGAFDQDVVRPMAAALFSDSPKSGVTTASTRPSLGAGPTLAQVPKPGSQTQVRLAFHVPGEDDPDSVALATLLGVLDDGMSSRLHRRIFDERGLAYNLGASLDIYPDVGALNFDATTSHENIAEVVAEILDIAKDLRDVRIPDEELEKARRRAAFGIEELMDDPLAMSLWYGEQQLFRTPPDLNARVKEYLSVTADDIGRVAQNVFTPQNLHVTTVGRKDARTQKAIDRALSRFG